MPTYYNRSGEDVLRQLHSSPKGLTEEQARQIALESGPNALTEGKKKGVVRIFLEQFKVLLVLILISAAVASSWKFPPGRWCPAISSCSRPGIWWWPMGGYWRTIR